jgi:hypothetical protein
VCGNGVCEGPAERLGCPEDCGPLPPVSGTGGAPATSSSAARPGE